MLFSIDHGNSAVKTPNFVFTSGLADYPVRPPVEQLAALPHVTITTSTDHDFELTARGGDKGAALAVIAERYGIPLDQCAAVGDSENDLSVLQTVGMPIVMDSAPRNVKERAVLVVPSNREEGAAQAMTRHLENARAAAFPFLIGEEVEL